MAGFIGTAIQLGAFVVLVNLIGSIKDGTLSTKGLLQRQSLYFTEARYGNTPKPAPVAQGWTEQTAKGGFQSGQMHVM